MNALAARISRVLAAAAALLAWLLSSLAGAGLFAVAMRSAAAFVLTWFLCDFVVRKALRAVLLRVLEDRQTHQIDVTLR